MNRDAPVGFHPYISDKGEVTLQKLVFLHGELWILALEFQIFLGIELAQDGDAVQAEPVCSHVGDLFRHVDIHAVNHRHHDNQRGGGEDNPQQREKAAQLA